MYMYTHKFTHAHTLTQAVILDIINMVCGMVAVYTYIYFSLTHTHAHAYIYTHTHIIHIRNTWYRQ